MCLSYKFLKLFTLLACLTGFGRLFHGVTTLWLKVFLQTSKFALGIAKFILLVPPSWVTVTACLVAWS